MTTMHIERDFIPSCNAVKSIKQRNDIIQMFSAVTQCTDMSLYDVCV